MLKPLKHSNINDFLPLLARPAHGQPWVLPSPPRNWIVQAGVPVRETPNQNPRLTIGARDPQ
eukprot:11962024-Alexandrium_andersonii.AAC.1